VENDGLRYGALPRPVASPIDLRLSLFACCFANCIDWAPLKRSLAVFIVLLAYIKPIDVVESHLPDHRDFLNRNYAAGTFLLSGRKEPRTGGIILANLDSWEELHAILAEDPFHRYGVAEYSITRFTATMAAPSLKWLLPA
jgi:uncharacterized protein YciI